MNKKVYIFLADGFEDIEGLTVVDLMRRADIDIKTVSIKKSKEITTSHGITMLTDLTFAETDFTDADMLVLPGGMPGTKYLNEYQPLRDPSKSWATMCSKRRVWRRSTTAPLSGWTTSRSRALCPAFRWVSTK